MSFFQNPYDQGEPEVCLSADGRVTNVTSAPVMPITMTFNNGGAGTPFAGSPLMSMTVQPVAVWAMNVIAWARLNYGDNVPSIEG